MSTQGSPSDSSPTSPGAKDRSGMSADDLSFSPIVVLGGGEAGSAVLEALSNAGLATNVALVDPSSYHYDQPEWMRVGTEGVDKEATRSPKEAGIPSSVTWVQSRVTKIDPEAQVVAMEDEAALRYDYLVVALGVEALWDRIRGVEANLGTHGVCSVYGYAQAEHTWDMIRAFEGGRAIFTVPSTPHKGGGAPLEVLRRAESLWRETGVRAQTDLFFTVAGPAGMKDPEGDAAWHERGTDGIHVYSGYELCEVRPEAREAVFNVKKGESRSRDVLSYDLLHVVPPMRPPALLEQSDLAYRDGVMKGYMEVQSDSLQHKRFRNVFGVGDAIGLEGMKTGERAREQAVIVARALEELLRE